MASLEVPHTAHAFLDFKWTPIMFFLYYIKWIGITLTEKQMCKLHLGPHNLVDSECSVANYAPSMQYLGKLLNINILFKKNWVKL